MALRPISLPVFSEHDFKSNEGCLKIFFARCIFHRAFCSMAFHSSTGWTGTLTQAIASFINERGLSDNFFAFSSLYIPDCGVSFKIRSGTVPYVGA